MSNKSKFTFFLCICLLFIALIFTIQASEKETRTTYIFKVGSNSVRILIDSEENYEELDYSVIIKDNRSFFNFSQKLGFKVRYNWYAIEKITEIILYDEKDNTLVMKVNSNEAYFNDEKFIMDVPPLHITEKGENYTLIPIRYTYEPFGYTVEWNSQTREITVYK